MKEFMLIFLGEDYADLGLSPEQMQGRMEKWHVWSKKMEAQGIIVSGEALHSDCKRITGPDRITTDLTSTELKEIVGGYYIVKAADMDAAAEIAQDFPDYDLGSTVEIREVMVFDNY